MTMRRGGRPLFQLLEALTWKFSSKLPLTQTSDAVDDQASQPSVKRQAPLYAKNVRDASRSLQVCECVPVVPRQQGHEGQAAPPRGVGIPLRNLVPDLDPTEYKLHCAVWNGSDHPLDVFARSWDEWVLMEQMASARDDFNRPFVFSLMQVYDEPNRWLFGGVFEMVGRGATPHSHCV